MEYTSIGIESTIFKNNPYTGKEKKDFENKDYVVLSDEYGSIRIIRKIEGIWVGGIQIMKRFSVYITANIYVDENYRRQGIAYELYKFSINRYPNLKHSMSLNEYSLALIKKLKNNGYFK